MWNAHFYVCRSAKDGTFLLAVLFTVSLVGHRDFDELFKVETYLTDIVEKLLKDHQYVDFYIGRNGEFDIAAASVIKRTLKNCDDKNGKLILVLPYAVKDEEYYEDYYDEIYHPISNRIHFKSAITKRNRWMVKNSDLLICFVDRKKGGAYETLKFAQEQGKKIINLATINK